MEYLTAKRKQIPFKLKQLVYKRDNKRCQICGKQTRFFKSLYDTPFDREPRAGSVDHVIPISKGGTNDIENLRWACRSCNCARGNR